MYNDNDRYKKSKLISKLAFGLIVVTIIVMPIMAIMSCY